MYSAPMADAAAEAPVEKKVEFTMKSALEVVIRNSLFNEGLCRGLHEVVKTLDRGQAHLVILSASCNEAAYRKLITALCKERGVPLLSIEDGKILGSMAGLARLKPDGTPAKLIGCSCVAIRSWGLDSEARAFVLQQVANQQNK